MRARFGALAAALPLAVGLGVVALPAEAATYITVCNRDLSDDPIRAYNNPAGTSVRIYPGSCASVNNSGGYARVDVDEGGYGDDINSWKKINGNLSQTYKFSSAPCYVNEDGASNPYNSGGTTYWTSVTSWCG